MRFTTVTRVIDLDIEAVDVEFVVENHKNITAVIIRDNTTGAEFHVKGSDTFSNNVVVLRRDRDEERATRYRLSGSVALGVGILEYFDERGSAEQREQRIRDDAPGARIDVEQVDVYLDSKGEVLAEIADDTSPPARDHIPF